MLRILFGFEILIFAGFYVYGPHGLHAQRTIEQEHVALTKEIEAIMGELNELNNKIAQWDAHPFFKEKIAREQLQMARKNDKIYYLSRE